MGYRKNGDGDRVNAPTFESPGMDVHWEGELYTATAGALSFFDKRIDTEIKVRGGWYELLDLNPVIGDYLEFSILDKDNALGLFSTYGLTVGSDVLELSKFVKKEYVSKLSLGRQEFLSEGATAVMQGLYFRTAYRSFGLVDVQFKAVFKTYE